MRRKIGIALALLGAWLLLDTTFSWLATRDPGYNSEPYDTSYNEECSALRGPLVLGLVGLKHCWYLLSQIRRCNRLLHRRACRFHYWALVVHSKSLDSRRGAAGARRGRCQATVPRDARLHRSGAPRCGHR